MNNNQKTSNVFYENVEEKTLQNELYRNVVYTGREQQFVYMNIKPNDDIHMETHPEHDQFIRIEQGQGQAIIDGKHYELFDGIGLIIPAGSKHQIINKSTSQELKLYSIYSPPEHPQGRIDVNNPDKIELEQYIRKYLKYKKKYLSIKK